MRLPRNDDLAVDHGEAAGSRSPERTCVLTRTAGARDALIRLAVDDEGQVFPDLAARAPGRGAWLSPDRGLIATAAARGKLRGALLRAFKTTRIAVPDDLADQIAAGLERRALDRLGLENKAGHLIWGSDRIGEAIAGGRARLLLHAADAAPDGMAKLDGRARGAGIRSIVLPADRARLSLALGRENVVHAAVCDSGAAARAIAAVDRWRAFNGLISGDATATSAVEMKVSG